MTRITSPRIDPGDRAGLSAAASHLDAGGVLAYPTETVYGIGARCDAAGVEAVRGVKGREPDRPFLVLLPPEGSGDRAAEDLAWTSTARELAERFWPGPLTLVLGDPSRTFPPGIRSDAGGVAVRRSPHPVVDALLKVWPHPLISTSANRAGGTPARSPDEVEAAVGDRAPGGLLRVLDGGRIPERPPSTVVDCTTPRPRLLREGAVPAGELLPVVPELDVEGAR